MLLKSKPFSFINIFCYLFHIKEIEINKLAQLAIIKINKSVEEMQYLGLYVQQIFARFEALVKQSEEQIKNK
ncbi:hypothetical protein [Borrelia miyamotoi]|uniref:Uncharacterized protein n=1 Tax=Borrelia miyamotoi FR64b TaxID=1292392 RepID=W5SGC1_9SPIR|nr:hypothetical protein [Borrelia miyamotoi]AHH05910.1 hypothetical protein BOM_1367 [Borrelia miyamotoi FR64b]WDE70484.1 hypothetical protein CNO12_07695 [Borrelia miyamotoi]WEG99727.1 hypothetical protein EZU69_007560 [Borrelia miyamotoi]